ncbi:sulfotransferase family protein [Psychroflexus sediminis]|uniref:Sulfotransferase domain-containing protein n=1 Tax=Psychroflexus sediminis TaxID=470826 RepID=A0A1G7ZDA2_9FLAO|nr:sulfotransferase [Psychroflexus sediminis]SDH06664.1 Sulfotransferase domain-containing protein [Psychroflexus sediminis]
MNSNKKSPNLIIPGFPKSGTSSLFDYLCQHPEIFRPKIKEPHTYAFDERYLSRFNSNEPFNFNNLYSNSENYKYVPDGSTIYLISDKALSRIKRDHKQAKIIIIARDPIERIFSHYNWLKMLGYEQKGFRKELLLENSSKFYPTKHIKGNYKNYIEFSMYAKQLKRCYKVFDSKNIYITSLERLRSEFEVVMNEIFNHLEIENIKVEKELKNKTPKVSRIRKRIPTKLKILERKINTNIISDSFIFNKKIKPIKFNLKDEEFVFNFLKKDLIKLEEMNLYFPEWETVNKYL